MKFKVYNDIHFFAPHALNVNLETSANVILNGDIVDLASCKKKEVGKAKNYIEKLRGIYGLRYVSGNHELDFWNKSYSKDGVVFTHGDYIFWGKEKADKFRSKAPGAGWLKRHIGIPIVNAVRPKQAELTVEEIHLCISEMKIYCDNTIVLGHKHFDKIIDIKVNKHRIIVLPRGVHEIEV